MKMLYITKLPEDKIQAAKTVRSIFKLLGVDSGLNGASDIIQLAERDGFTYMGSTEDQSVADTAMRLMAEAGGEIKADIDVCWPVESPQEIELSTPEEAKTALLLMGWAEGNPVLASVQASGLGRTTGDYGFYERIIDLLLETFPWIEEHLRENNVIE